MALRRRIAVAVALLVGFYVIALVLLAGLLVIGVGPWITEDIPGNLWISIASLASAFVIARSLVPRRAPFVDPGPRLDPAEEPELFDLVRDVADATGQEMPADVYVDDEYNAAVTERGGVLGIGGERVLILGLPLLDTLTVDQLKSVIAHEFGHYSGGDTKLGSFFFRTYDGIDRAIEGLEKRESFWRHLFIWYGRFFLRRTGAVRRSQEFAADAVAAEVAGRDTTARALWSVAGCSGAFGSYMETEFVPTVNSGVLPPFREGFARFRSAPGMREATAEHLEERMREETHPYDTHPSLGERLSSLGVEDASALPANGPVAATLLRDADALEERLMRDRLGDSFGEVERASWDDVPERSLVPSWQEEVHGLADALEGFDVRSMPELIEELARPGGALIESVDEDDPPAPEDLRRVAAMPAACAFALALHNSGWKLDAPLGEPIRLSRDGEEPVLPFERVGALSAGELSAEEWRSWAADAGVAEIALGAGAAREERETVGAAG